MHNLANHVLSQSSFYPLNPPASNFNLDMSLWEYHSFMEQQPHVLILPSDLRAFCKSINNTLVINPMRLAKDSYARIKIKATAEGKWEANDVSCEIRKL